MNIYDYENLLDGTSRKEDDRLMILKDLSEYLLGSFMRIKHSVSEWDIRRNFHTIIDSYFINKDFRVQKFFSYDEQKRIFTINISLNHEPFNIKLHDLDHNSFIEWGRGECYSNGYFSVEF